MKRAILAGIIVAMTLPAAADERSFRKHDPLEGHCFEVEIEGVTVGTFKEVKDLENNVETVDIQQGDTNPLRKRPGATKIGDVVLRKSNASNLEIEAWWNAVQNDSADMRPYVVKLIDNCTPPPIYDEFPTTWKITGTVEIDSADKAKEEISISVEQIQFAEARD